MILLVIMGERNTTDALWLYIKLSLKEYFTEPDLRILEKNIKETAKEIEQYITLDDIIAHKFTKTQNEDEETLEGIKNEIKRLDDECNAE